MSPSQLSRFIICSVQLSIFSPVLYFFLTWIDVEYVLERCDYLKGKLTCLHQAS